MSGERQGSEKRMEVPRGILPYLEFCQKYPDILPKIDGVLANGEFRRLTDPEEIQRVIEATGYGPFGYDGPFSIFVVHPVQRPDGSYGLFHQVDWKFAAELRTGCVTIPIWNDNGVRKIGLVKHYRFPVSGITNPWYAEVPRFSQRRGQTVRQTITDEAFSELNARIVGEVRRLDNPEEFRGGVAMENGLGSQVNPVWYVEVEPLPGDPHEMEEGITGRIFLTREEYDLALARGTVMIGGQECSTLEAHSFLASEYGRLHDIF